MARQPVSVRRLTRIERSKLEELFRHPPDGRVHERALAIRLASQGQSPPAVAEVLGRSRTSVWRWVSDFNTRGLAALYMGKSSGAPPKADADVCAAMDEAVTTNPQDLGYPFTRWSAALLAEHIRRTLHVALSEDTVRRVLHRHGYRYGRPKLDLKHKQKPSKVRRAKAQKTAAKKKWKPAPVVILSRFSTRQSSISIPS